MIRARSRRHVLLPAAVVLSASVVALGVGPRRALANSLVVTSGAGLGDSGFGLEIVLDDPAVTPATDAWLSVGPEKGFADDDSIFGGFLLDASSLTVGVDGVTFLTFYDQHAPITDQHWIIHGHR